jgi:hypothetical protein
MKKLILFSAIGVFLTQICFAQTYQFKDSSVADNLYVRVYLTAEKTNLDAASKIIFGILEKTNETIAPMIYFPQMTYFCEIELVDSKGVSLPKSLTGEKYGQQFTKLKNYSWDAVNKKGHNTGGSDKPDMAIVHTNSTSGPDLPSVQELFKVERADEYKLLLQFQVFKLIQTPTNHTFKIVRIPQIEIPVVKSLTR